MESTKIWFLENFSMLQILSPQEMKMMDERTTMRDVPKNKVLYFSEDSNKSEFGFFYKTAKRKCFPIILPPARFEVDFSLDK